jgi:TonB family protein
MVVVPIYTTSGAPIRDTILGDAEGKGDAADVSPGDEPMQAALAPQAQAFLSRDPEGPGRVGQDPSMSTQIPGENGNGDDAPPAMFGAATPPAAQPAPAFAPPKTVTANEPTEPVPYSKRGSLTNVIGAPITLEPSPNDRDPSRSTAQDDNDQQSPDHKPDQAVPPVAYASLVDPTPAPRTPPAPPQPQAQSAGGGKPGPAVAAADPAPQSDSESDPFSKSGAVKFKRGSTDIQFGRKHKIVRPRLGLAGEADMLNLRQPITLVLALTLDETGKVISVTVIKSSGSNNVDQACKVAAYQWWLEPTKDKATGKPVKDVVPFVIGFS